MQIAARESCECMIAAIMKRVGHGVNSNLRNEQAISLFREMSSNDRGTHVIFIQTHLLHECRIVGELYSTEAVWLKKNGTQIRYRE